MKFIKKRTAGILLIIIPSFFVFWFIGKSHIIEAFKIAGIIALLFACILGIAYGIQLLSIEIKRDLSSLHSQIEAILRSRAKWEKEAGEVYFDKEDADTVVNDIVDYIKKIL